MSERSTSSVKKSWDITNCCVSNCYTTKHKNRALHFHAFPKKGASTVQVTNDVGVIEKMDRREVWAKALLMEEPITNCMRVCSLHFQESDYLATGASLLSMKSPRLKITAVPSLNLPKEQQTKFGQIRIVQKKIKSEKSLNEINLDQQRIPMELEDLNEKEQKEIVEIKIKEEITPSYLCNDATNEHSEKCSVKIEEQFTNKSNVFNGEDFPVKLEQDDSSSTSEQMDQIGLFSAINTEENHENTGPKTGCSDLETSSSSESTKLEEQTSSNVEYQESDYVRSADINFKLELVYVKEEDHHLYISEGTEEIDQDSNKLKCSYDGYTGNDKSPIKAVPSNENQLQCSFCNYVGSQDYILSRHIMTAHSNTKHFRCPHCQYVCGYQEQIDKHVHSSHRCPSCDYIGGFLQKHIESVHVSRQSNECDLCAYVGSRKDHLENVIQSSYLLGKYECPYCDYITQRKASFRAHLLTNHKCNTCDFVGCCKEHLKKHWIEAHPIPNHKKCPYCDYVGEHRGFVKIHVNSNHKCHMCGYVGDNIGMHVKSAHNAKIDRKCNFCDYVGDADHLSRHSNYVHFEVNH